MVSVARRMRTWVAKRTDPYVLRRFRTLAERAELGRDSAEVEDAVVRALEVLADHHRHARSATPAIEAAVVEAFVSLYDRDLNTLPPEPVVDAITKQFNRLYYHAHDRTWKSTTYRGTTVWKCPMDLWTYQELLHVVEPDLIVETGTAYGGSGLYLADLCDLFGRGHVVSIDIDEVPGRPVHPRLTYLLGSSVAPSVVAQVESMWPPSGRVLVILDSDHSEAHVSAELDTWAHRVPVGSYVIVEDTNVNGHPSFPEHGPGPMEALDAFLEREDRFEVDAHLERRFLTFNPRGALKRVR